MKVPKLVIFDMDGLLFDSETICFQIMKEVTYQHGYIFTEEIYRKAIGSNDQVEKDIIMSFMPNSFPYEAIKEEVEAKLKEYTTNKTLPVKKGAYQLLNYLKEANITCCVCSSSYDNTIQRYLEKAALTNYFEFVFGGNHVNRSKPDPEIFLKALAYHNSKAEEALVLEDSENGILAAYRANIPVICVPDMIMPSREHQEYTRCIVSSLDKIIELF